MNAKEKRLVLFHTLYKCGTFLPKSDTLWVAAKFRLEKELAKVKRKESEAICTAASRYFGVTTRSMQRLYVAFYGRQR